MLTSRASMLGPLSGGGSDSSASVGTEIGSGPVGGGSDFHSGTGGVLSFGASSA